MKVATIGIGNKGFLGGVLGPYTPMQTHVGAIEATPGLELVAVADVDVEKLTAFKEARPDVSAFTDYEDMMYTKPDIVAVVTPPSTHAQIAKNLMRYDSVKCIVLEKPACVYETEGASLLKMQKEFGTPVIVNHSRRYMYNWQAFIKAVKEASPVRHAIGVCNGEPLDAGVHMFDLFNWINAPMHTYVDLYEEKLGKYRPYLVFDLIAYCEKGVIAMMNNGYTLISVPTGKRAYRDLNEALWDEAETNFFFNQVELETAMVAMYKEALTIAEGKRKKPTCSLKDGVKAVGMANRHCLGIR